MSTLMDARVCAFEQESSLISQSGAEEVLLFPQFSDPNTDEKYFSNEMDLISDSESRTGQAKITSTASALLEARLPWCRCGLGVSLCRSCVFSGSCASMVDSVLPSLLLEQLW